MSDATPLARSSRRNATAPRGLKRRRWATHASAKARSSRYPSCRRRARTSAMISSASPFCRNRRASSASLRGRAASARRAVSIAESSTLARSIAATRSLVNRSPATIPSSATRAAERINHGSPSRSTTNMPDRCGCGATRVICCTSSATEHLQRSNRCIWHS